jgi:transcriptional regulator with XRE-family HTH domain
MIKPEQIRAARALLRLEQQDLAQRAHVSIATVRRLEAENGIAGVAPITLIRVQRALEAAGAEFIPYGVKRRRARTPEEKEALLRDIMAIAHRTARFAAEHPGFTEDDLYEDETGLPA